MSHQQELRYSGLEAAELTEAVLVTTLDLALLAADPRRREVRAEAAVTAAGEVSALVYWWTLDYGWSVKETTRECDIYHQARENIFTVKNESKKHGKKYFVRRPSCVPTPLSSLGSG